MWSARAAATATLDADGALGLVAGRMAADRAVELARSHGVGAVSVANSNHFGAASCYTLRMARRGAIGFCCSNSDALVAPFGGRAPFFGTNPLSLAARGQGGELVCADFATSQVSYSKVLLRREGGRPLGRGWAIGAEGRDASELDPGDSIAALSPLGGHKGEGLAMIVQVLSALLAGEPMDHELGHFYEPPFDRPRRIAHLFLAFDVAAFTGNEHFRRRLSEQLARLRLQPASDPSRPVQAPGDPEAESARDRARRGIPVADSDLAWLTRLAESEGVDLSGPGAAEPRKRKRREPAVGRPR